MTEQKAKEVVNNIWNFADAQDEEKGDVVDDAIIEVIGCMEEVEQYRALGTVEELKEAREKQSKSDWIPCEVEMPKEMKEVLISRENSKTGTSVGYYNRVFGWYDQCLLRGVTDVVAWMPKPMEYKKEGAE